MWEGDDDKNFGVSNVFVGNPSICVPTGNNGEFAQEVPLSGDIVNDSSDDEQILDATSPLDKLPTDPEHIPSNQRNDETVTVDVIETSAEPISTVAGGTENEAANISDEESKSRIAHSGILEKRGKEYLVITFFCSVYHW
jgi:hypothetical protein